jgi:hypothetical protein
MPADVVFTVNGPGELGGIALPLVRAFKQRFPQHRYILFTVPCQFSSGSEVLAARAAKVFDFVFTVTEYTQYIFKQHLPQGYTPNLRGIVFYCGGDSFHALKLSQKFSYPVFAYDDGSLTNVPKFHKVFNKNIDGDLMVDAALARGINYQAVPIGSAKVTVGLYPGTRPGHLKFMVPFLSQVATKLLTKYPRLKFRWGINDNVRELFTTTYQSSAYAAPLETTGDSYDLVVSIVGTNTAINGALGIPMVVLLPLNDPKQLPFVGLFGLLSNIPWFGLGLKLIARSIVMRSKRLLAIPNRKAGRMIVPEIKGILTVDQVAEQIESLLINIKERENMHYQLPIFMGKPAAAKIVKYFERIL